MSFTVIIPARLASTRLPNKPLADLGGKPMVVRVAERAALSGADRVVVATDHADIVAACERHGVAVRMTRADHPSGTDRIAEVAAALGLTADAVVVNVQGDEPLIDPALIAATAARIAPDVPMATAAHPLTDPAEVFNPNVVKVVLDKLGRALYFSRATIPWHRDGFAPAPEPARRCLPAMRRCATSACTPIAMNSCRLIRNWRCRRWSRSRHSSNCASCGTVIRSPCMSPTARRPPASIRRKTWRRVRQFF